VLLEKEVMGREVNIRDMSGDRTLIRFGTGDEVTVQAGPEGVRFLLISGAPIEEPVAWHGPIVMNTQAELQPGDARSEERHLHQARALRPARRAR
jgi:redox-sensitive bicupin YhaK (pirin superfamily)